MTDLLEGLDDDAPAPVALLPRAPRRNGSCTEAAYRFQLRHYQIFDFFFFAIKLSTHVDKARFAASKALAALGDKKYVESFEALQRDPEPTFRKVQSFGEYLSELLIIGLVDNFMSFLSECLQACMSKKPELLRSKEQVKTEDVLRFTNRRELLDFLVNRKLNELAYEGVRGIEEFLDQRLNIGLVQGMMKELD